MRKDLKEWWNTYQPHIGMTPWEFMQRMGDEGFDVGSYVTDSYAEWIKTFNESSMLYDNDDVPERNDYWKENGVLRTVYGDTAGLDSYTVYCPVKRSRMSYARLKELGNKNLYYHEYSDPELKRFGIDTDNEVGSHYSAWLDYAGNDMFRWLFSFRRDQ